MITAMGGMTVQAVFNHGRMFENEGSSFFRMAFETKFINGIGLDLVIAECAMGIMAVGALDQTLPDWMMGLSGGLRTDIFMAFKA